MAATQLEIGDHIYLFCQKGSFAPRLVISSHGATGGTFDTPRKLIFYADPGDTMTDETIAAITRGAAQVREQVGAGTNGTDDYDLSKYQSDEGEGPETYTGLLGEVQRLSGGSEEDLWDIATIRHRRGIHSKDVTLSYVLDKLRREQPERFAAYREVHCSFCRV